MILLGLLKHLPSLLANFNIYHFYRSQNAKARRNFGGISLPIRKSIKDGITIFDNKNSSFVWIKIDKKFFGLLNDLFICFLHIPPENSTYSQNHGDQFENLTNDVLNYYDKGDILLCGDFNGRVSTAQDFVINDSISNNWNDDDEYCVDSCRYRNSLDKVTTARGRHIIDLCIQSRLRILNGRTLGDLEGSFTFHNSLGSSVIDYFITSDSFLEQIMFMKVHNFIKSLSDHCCLSVNFKVDIRADINKNDDTSKSLMPCPDKYIWDDKSITKFQNILSSNSISSKIKSFKDVDYNVCENSVNIATNDINGVLYEAANLSLKKKNNNLITCQRKSSE